MGEREGLVFSLTFSPDGQTLAAGTVKGEVELWDVASGRRRSLLRGHSGGVWGLAFAPDVQTLAYGSDDGTVRIWDTRPAQDITPSRAAFGPANGSRAFDCSIPR
jgi:WD40 repeat protein